MLRPEFFPSIRSWLCAMVLASLLLPQLALADGLRLTPYLGYRIGGEFEDADTGSTLDLDETESYGLIISQDADDAIEFSLSRQPTELSANSEVSSADLFDVDVYNLMVGGKSIVDADNGSFVSGMAGVTHFDPREAGLSSDTRFALGIGAGIDYPLTERLSFRFEGRGIATFLDSSGGVFCSSSRGCLAYADSSLLLQFEVLSGLSFRF